MLDYLGGAIVYETSSIPAPQGTILALQGNDYSLRPNSLSLYDSTH